MRFWKRKATFIQQVSGYFKGRLKVSKSYFKIWSASYKEQPPLGLETPLLRAVFSLPNLTLEHSKKNANPLTGIFSGNLGGKSEMNSSNLISSLAWCSSASEAWFLWTKIIWKPCLCLRSLSSNAKLTSAERKGTAQPHPQTLETLDRDRQLYWHLLRRNGWIVFKVAPSPFLEQEHISLSEELTR